MNFRRFDPEYKGKGMQHGGKDEEVVWNLYAHDPDELRKVANAVTAFVASDADVPPLTLEDAEEAESEEGAILTRVHRYRERDSKIIKRKKGEVLGQHGRLTCEVCGFEFGITYGKQGEGFIECHHTKPVSQIKVGEKTKLADLVLLCSNCHRMVHRKRPWLSIVDLSTIVKR
jgi:5-methylcytosine-specific restriction protein A